MNCSKICDAQDLLFDLKNKQALLIALSALRDSNYSVISTSNKRLKHLDDQLSFLLACYDANEVINLINQIDQLLNDARHSKEI